jgi:hypothetical protein
MGIKLASARYGLSLPGEREIADLLARAGFRKVAVAERSKYEFFPSSRDFFLSIKKRGANNPNFRPMSLKTERTLLKETSRIYDERFHLDGQVYASYEVLFARGSKPEVE